MVDAIAATEVGLTGRLGSRRSHGLASPVISAAPAHVEVRRYALICRRPPGAARRFYFARRSAVEGTGSRR